MDETRALNREYLTDRKVCATGHLVSMTHAELGELVRSCGGTYVRMPTRSDVVVVVGDAGWPAEGDGSPNQVLVRARRLRTEGCPVELVSEDQFLDAVGLTDPAGAIRGYHTIVDLARLLDISAIRIRQWVRSGLIVPVSTTHRLAYFDFRQVSFARRLSELVESGVSLSAVRNGIEQFEEWLPSARDHLLQLTRWEASGGILLRLGDKLYDASGQRYFDFETTDNENAALALPDRTELPQNSTLFDQALEAESDERLDEAADLYRKAIARKPDDPLLRFNLGNVLYGLGQLEASCSCFGEALARDPQYAEAWNNLGNVYTGLERWEDAEDALQQAVQLVPSYADAHFNLAEVLEHLERTEDAAVHREAYEQYRSKNQLRAQHKNILKIFED